MKLPDIHPLILVAVGVVVLLNIIVTIGLVRDDGTTPFQKSVQGLMIWIVPFLGAGIILTVIGSHHDREEMKSLVPFPFYLAAYRKPEGRESPNADPAGGVVDGTCGAGGCGD